jgi:protein-tyrosine-phosphatase
MLVIPRRRERVKKILFLRTANTYRSPMAQAIFDTLGEDKGLRFRAESAGTEALEGTAIAENAVAALEERGSTRGSTAHGGERGDGRGGRVVLAMNPRQSVALELLEGDSPLGIHTLPEYTTGVAREGIPDVLRRLMCNSGRRRRSRTLLLVPNLRPKVVPHDGSRLLLGLIVRAGGRLVEGQTLFGAAQGRPSGAACRLRGHHPGHPRPVASLEKRARFLALCSSASELLLPDPLLPKPAQPEGTRPGARVARPAARGRRDALWASAVYHVLDTTLIPAIVRVRASRKGLFAGQATFGRCASKTEWVYGFKVALSVSPEGVIRAFGLAEAASDERPIADFLIVEDPHDAYLADKGFAGVEWERCWSDLYGALVAATPKDNSKRAWTKADRRWASGKRQIIEGVIDQLKDLFGLERHRAKTLEGLLARLAAKIAAYTCGQWINERTGRPLRHLADLLV